MKRREAREMAQGRDNRATEDVSQSLIQNESQLLRAHYTPLRTLDHRNRLACSRVLHSSLTRFEKTAPALDRYFERERERERETEKERERVSEREAERENNEKHPDLHHASPARRSPRLLFSLELAPAMEQRLPDVLIVLMTHDRVGNRPTHYCGHREFTSLAKSLHWQKRECERGVRERCA